MFKAVENEVELAQSTEIKYYYSDSRSQINLLADFSQHPWVIQAKNRVGESFFYKGDQVVPVVMDVGYINAHLDQYAWYVEKADNLEPRRVMPK